MIKGVNRRVVEITSTDSDYFEKAVLYVRSDKSEVPAVRLEAEAREYIRSLVPEKPRSVPLALKLGAAAASAAALTLIIYLIICL